MGLKPEDAFIIPRPHPFEIPINSESLTILLRANISCHANKVLNKELIDQLTAQIIESINHFIKK